MTRPKDLFQVVGLTTCEPQHGKPHLLEMATVSVFSHVQNRQVLLNHSD